MVTTRVFVIHKGALSILLPTGKNWNQVLKSDVQRGFRNRAPRYRLSVLLLKFN